MEITPQIKMMKDAYDAGRNNPHKDESIEELMDFSKSRPEPKCFENWYESYIAIQPVNNKTDLPHGKPLEYWKKNAEEDYAKVPISVLRYITILEEKQVDSDDIEFYKWTTTLTPTSNENCFNKMREGYYRIKPPIELYKIFKNR